MDCCCDAVGFPMVVLPGGRHAVGLWPLLKVQFERFLAEPGRATDPLMAELLAVSPRLSWRTPEADRLEELALTGVLPDDLAAFNTWMGNGTRVIRLDEWRSFDRLLDETVVPAEWFEQVRAMSRLHPAARLLLGWMESTIPNLTFRRLAWLSEGILEWVQAHARIGALGRPRAGLLEKPILLNPQLHEPLSPIPLDRRRRAYGTRLIRSLPG